MFFFIIRALFNNDVSINNDYWRIILNKPNFDLYIELLMLIEIILSAKLHFVTIMFDVKVLNMEEMINSHVRNVVSKLEKRKICLCPPEHTNTEEKEIMCKFYIIFLKIQWQKFICNFKRYLANKLEILWLTPRRIWCAMDLKLHDDSLLNYFNFLAYGV